MSNYPTLPRRINYDIDGTVSWYKTANATTTPLVADTSFLENMNNESSGSSSVITLRWSNTTNPGHPPFVLLKFPREMDITGVSLFEGNSVQVSTSNDTTDGLDGTWSPPTTVTPSSGFLRDWSRSDDIASMSATNVQFLRLELPMVSTSTLGKVRIFGEPSSPTGETLYFWDATLDQPAELGLFDFGDRARGTSASRTFRVKNVSTMLRATGVSVTRDSRVSSSPSVPGFHDFSLNEIDWSGNLNLGDLDPEEISPVITMRQTVPPDALLWLWQMRVVATPNGWEAP